MKFLATTTPKLFLAAASILGLSLTADAAAAPQVEGGRINIVFILADDLGWSDVSCNGQKLWATPNIDRIAAGGMRFTRAYAASPVCSPTRASILTGKYPHRLGMTGILEMAYRPYKVPDNAVVLPAKTEAQLPAGEVTVAAALKAGGYATGMVGKWHVGGHPREMGFDAWACYTSGNNQPRFVNGRFFTEVQAEAAVAWIREQRDRPFFLYFAPHAVHAGIAAVPEYVADFRKRGLPANGAWNATYAAYVQHLDEAVGRILAEIDALKLAGRTAVFFFSDNGGRGLDVSRNDPWRGGKGQLYEGGIREPLLVRWPGVVPPGSVCESPVISTDFYPTFLELAGLPLRPVQHSDGTSLLSLLKGARTIERDTLFWHHPHYSTVGVPHSAIVAKDWKLIQYYSGYRREWDEGRKAVVERQSPLRIELFALGRDPSEREDVAVEEPVRAETLQRELNAHLKALSARLPPRNPAIESARKDLSTERYQELKQQFETRSK